MKKFFIFWSSQAVSLFGSAVVGFALAWYLAEETGSPTILSTAMMVNFLPMVFLGPFIGPFIDRWNRKKIIIITDLASALLTLVLVVLFAADAIEVWHIYVIMFLRATAGTIQFPAVSASVPLIVPKEQLVRANGLNSILHGVINLIGPPTGAFLMEALSVQWVLSVDVITAAIAILILIPLAIPQPEKSTLPEKVSVIGDMKQSFRYMFAWKGLFYLLILAALLNFFVSPLNSLLPLFVTNHLGGDVLKLGWLGTVMGAGVIVGGLILSAWGGFKNRIHTVFFGLVLWCLVIAAFGFTTEQLFWLGMITWFLSGVCSSIFNAPVLAIVQSTVPQDMQGRVFTVLSATSTATIPLSLAIAGPVAELVGLRAIYQYVGGIMLVIVLLFLTSRRLRNLEQQNTNDK